MSDEFQWESEIGVCMVVHDNYHLTRLAIKHLKESAGVVHHLYILDNSSTDLRLKEYLIDIQKDNKVTVKRSEKLLHLSEAYTMICSLVQEKYTCLHPVNYVSGNGWLSYLRSTLHDAISLLHKTELVGLKPLPEKETSTILEEGVFLYEPQSRCLTGVIMWETKLGHERGLFYNETPENYEGYETELFSFNFALHGSRVVYCGMFTINTVLGDRWCTSVPNAETQKKFLAKRKQMLFLNHKAEQDEK